MIEFSDGDKKQITETGHSVEQIIKQIELLSTGKNFLELIKPATVDNGRIKQIQDSDFSRLIDIWKKNISSNIVKFIPASGAASRMFKALNTVYSENFDKIKEVSDRIESGNGEKLYLDFMTFWKNLKTFPFYDELKSVMTGNGFSLDEEYDSGLIQNILKYLLTEEGMDYANKPKLFLTFHIDNSNSRLAMEEHIKESLWLTGGKLHFTVTPSHMKAAKELADFFTKKYKESGFDINISFSVQDPATDSVALTLETNEIHRNPDGSLFFRQSGHGALSKNIDRLYSNYILIQNVDNLAGGSDEILDWKKAFMGLFFTIEERAHVLARGLANKDILSEDLINEAYGYATGELNRTINKTKFDEKDLNEKAKILLDIYNRPVVLAGMVPNEGEPGGGPFVVKDCKTGLPVNQIVEGAQQDHSDPEQVEIIKRATHFNPVFLIMNTKDAWGKKFDLENFAKREGGYVFYVEKSDSEGKEFASIDTGLWNGEIADMNILFAEIPLKTFCPAKTVLDLNPEIRTCRNNPYPEIVHNISPDDVLEILNRPSSAFASAVVE